MKQGKTEEYILMGIAVVPVIWLSLLIAPYIDKGLLNVMVHTTDIFDKPFYVVWTEKSLPCVCVGLLIYLLGIALMYSNKRNYRRKEEHGSAKWGSTKEVNKKYVAKPVNTNKILTQNVRIGLDGRKHRRNLNVLVVGGSGAGKTRFFAKPNVMQCSTSYVVLDPKGGARRSYMKSVRTSQI